MNNQCAYNPTSSPFLEDLLRSMTVFGVNRHFASNVLAKLSRGDLKDLLRQLAANPVWMERAGSQAYLHANGFYKIPLCTVLDARVRLHFWTGEFQAEENIHNHRWNFASRVLVGHLESEAYEECTKNTESAISLLAYDYRKKERGSIAALATALGPKTIRLVERTTRYAGCAYAMKHGQYHRIIKQDRTPTLTLMVQSAPVRVENSMLTCKADLEPDVDPRPLGVGGLRVVLDQILVHLNSLEY